MKISRHILIGFLLFGCQVGDVVRVDKECLKELQDPLTDVQVAALASCCEVGPAHCVPAHLVKKDMVDDLDACGADGLCVPDRFLTVAGGVPLTECTAVGGGAGVCLSRCLPKVAEYADVLQQDVCKDGEACTPCIDPADGSSTEACELSADATCVIADDIVENVSTCDRPVQTIDPNRYTSCAADAHCIDAGLVKHGNPEFIDRFEACADEPGKLCVPDIMFQNGDYFQLSACTSIEGREGRCLSKTIPEIEDAEDFMPRSSCAAEEVCVPCYDLVDGADEDICNRTCDSASTSAAPLATCGERGLGRCYPEASITNEEALDILDRRECQDGYLCVSNEVLQNGPWRLCSGDLPLGIGPYVGLCMNTDVLSIAGSGIFDVDGCDVALGEGFRCVPCYADGEAADLPGCERSYPQYYPDVP
jgi:hypothetical protein